MVSEKEKVSAEISVSGRVQMVGYRSFAEMAASRYGLTGYAKNMDDGRVLIEVEGRKAPLEAFIEKLKQGPPRASVTDVRVTWRPYEGRFSDFSIRF